jgi:hypothetical protein
MRNSVSLPPFDPRAISTTARGDIDVLDWIDGLRGLFPRIGRPRVPKAAPLVVSGWAIDPTSAERPRAVMLVVDDGLQHAAETGFDRTDVRAELGPETPNEIGFRAIVPLENIAPGSHGIRAFVLGADGAWYDAAHESFYVYEGVNAGLAPGSGKSRIFVDNIIDVAPNARRGPVDAAVRLGNFALVTGWAVDVTSRQPPAGVCAIDERGRIWSAPCDLSRPDVRTAIGAASDTLGFEIIIATEELGRGRHRLKVTAYDGAGRQFGRSHEVFFDVAAEARPFPGFARLSGDPIATAVRLTVAEQTFVPTPSKVVTCRRGDVLLLEGWAVVGDDLPAQVFLELHPRGVVIPPLRYQAVSGFRRKSDSRDLPPPPSDDAWFQYALDTSSVAAGAYTLYLAAVKPGRCFYARGELGTVLVGAPDVSAGAGRLL